MDEGKPAWTKLGCLATALGLFIAWDSFTRAVPPQEPLVSHEGRIEKAGWSGGRRTNQFIITLANDTRRYALQSAIIKEKFGPPTELAWIGKNARLIADDQANRFTGRFLVHSLELDGRNIYDVDDLREFRRDQRPKLLLFASAILLFGVCILVWRMLTFTGKSKDAAQHSDAPDTRKQSPAKNV